MGSNVSNSTRTNTVIRISTRSRLSTRIAGGVAAVAMVASLAACGDTDEQASTCDALKDLSAQVTGLANVDLVGEGTSALNEQINAIETSWNSAKDAADNQFASQFAALQSSLTALGSTVESFVNGEQGLSESMSALSAEVTAVSDAWSELATTAEAELGDCDLNA